MDEIKVLHAAIPVYVYTTTHHLFAAMIHSVRYHRSSFVHCDPCGVKSGCKKKSTDVYRWIFNFVFVILSFIRYNLLLSSYTCGNTSSWKSCLYDGYG